MSSISGDVEGFLISDGPVTREPLVCQHVQSVGSKGIFLDDNPFDYSLPTLLAEIVILTVFTKVIYFLLKPLHQSIALAQVIAGIVTSPAIIWRAVPDISKLYPPGGKLILQTGAEIGFMIHLFLVGVQTDVKILKKAGREAFLIGTTSFAMPYTLGGFAVFYLIHKKIVHRGGLALLTHLAAINSMTSFPVVTSVLTELKILNSEIGRLATYTAMICDACDWLMSIIIATIGVSRKSSLALIWSFTYIAMFIFFIFFIVRPSVLWMIKRSPEDPLNEFNFFVIIFLVLGCGLCSEVFGLHAAFGPYLLGIALPDGPPFGAALVGKFETFTNEVLLPIFFAISGLRTDFFNIKWRRVFILVGVLGIGNIGKLIGTLLPALYCGIPFWDAFTLTLIMSCKGIIEIAAYNHLLDRGILDSNAFNLLVLNMLFITAVAKPLVAYLYDPSKRYMTYTRRTIQHNKKDGQFRMLICIHCHDNIPTILAVLEASNPTRYTPIAAFVLFMKELAGRSSAILIPHHSLSKAELGSADQISNAFRNLEQQHLGSVVVQHFTAVAPFASMHNDICTMALDKRTTLIILPFHKRWGITGDIESSVPSIRTVNQNVINKAPCSVGILIDRGQVTGTNQSFLSGKVSYRVAMIFLGGPDDPEALAYSIRMAEHPNVNLMVVHVRHENANSDKVRHFISDSRANSSSRESINYKEDSVQDGVGTTNVIRAIENTVDLVIVGRQQEFGSAVIAGLEDWNEYPELGVLGDVLATWDFPFSVLVVQQEPLTPAAATCSLRLKTTKYTRSFSDDSSAEYAPV